MSELTSCADPRSTTDPPFPGLHPFSCHSFPGTFLNDFDTVQELITFQDSFYKELNESQLQLAFSNQYDFDHPDALDMDEFAAVRDKLS